jgi:diguanylate cyclase (GGDEF)-like protein
MGFLLTDINGLKLVNDHYGHRCGDFLKNKAVEQINRYIPSVDVFARLGGDEFAILIKDITHEEYALSKIRARTKSFNSSRKLLCRDCRTFINDKGTN